MTETKEKSVQDRMLEEIKGKDIRIYLMNGFQMNGRILNHDDSCIEFRQGESYKLIYKHAISTIEF